MSEEITEKNFTESVKTLLEDNELGMKIFLELFAKKKEKDNNAN